MQDEYSQGSSGFGRRLLGIIHNVDLHVLDDSDMSYRVSSPASQVLSEDTVNSKEVHAESVRLQFMNNPSKALEFLEFDLKVVKNGFCWQSEMVPSKENGYIQISYQGANKFCTLGEMLGWAAGLSNAYDPSLQISHRCHNPRCGIPAHITLETAVENNRRKGCKVWIDCPHRGCQDKILVCDHRPTCIKSVPGFETWEDFMMTGVHRINAD